MTASSRLNVTVPVDLLDAVDRVRARHGESRSAFVRRLLEQALADADERAAVERYVRGYRDQPQTEEEFGWSDQVIQEALAEVHWP